MELIKLELSNKSELKGFYWKSKIDIKGNVIIVTGMAEYAGRYDEFASYLASNGYDVYCIDHYGQGENVENENEHMVVPSSFFSKSVKNIDLIVKKLRKSCLPTYIFGHSMGSFFVQDYIQRFTDHVNKVVICGSNGPNAKTLYMASRRLTKLLVTKSNFDKPSPFFEKLAVGSFNKKISNPNTPCDWLSYNKENVENYINDDKCGQMGTYGFYKELIKGNNRLYKNKFMKKIRSDMKILIISGQDDPAGACGKGPKSLKEKYSKLHIDDVTLKLYENMRHEILCENEKEIVFKDVLEFFNKEHNKADIITK